MDFWLESQLYNQAHFSYKSSLKSKTSKLIYQINKAEINCQIKIHLYGATAALRGRHNLSSERTFRQEAREYAIQYSKQYTCS